MNFTLDTLTKAFKRCEKVMLAVKKISEGETLILTDDEDRENEGDLVFAAEAVSPEKVNFLAKEARGLICLSLAPHIVDKLELPMMRDPKKSSPLFDTAFTMSIEAKEGVTTGISASDRAHTISLASSAEAKPEDFVIPGHIFPLKAHPKGVLGRCGHTEASIDLAGLAGKKQAAVICEILREDGELARQEELKELASKHGLYSLTIRDLIIFRMLKEKVLENSFSKTLKTETGLITASFFDSLIDKSSYISFYEQKNYETNDPVTVFVVEDFFKEGETPEALFSRTLFLFKRLLKADRTARLILCQKEKDKEENLYEKTKQNGFLLNLTIELGLHKRDIQFQKLSRNPSDSDWFHLNLAPQPQVDYKERL